MPIRSCVTISLVPEARGGPFVFWDGLEAGCEKARALGFDAVEVFPPSASDVDANDLGRLLNDLGLGLAAVGTGAGWVKHRLTLTSPDASIRAGALDFVKSIIDLGGPFGAPAIIGSMQGRSGDGLDRASALGFLKDALDTLGEHASRFAVPLLYEPLNRYETDLINLVADGVTLLERLSSGNVKLLNDLFHMNIEEVDIAGALRLGGRHVGHVHFVDSNRQAAGFGHLDFEPIAQALRDIHFDGFASAEALPRPDSDSAALQTISSFRSLFAGRED